MTSSRLQPGVVDQYESHLLPTKYFVEFKQMVGDIPLERPEAKKKERTFDDYKK